MGGVGTTLLSTGAELLDVSRCRAFRFGTMYRVFMVHDPVLLQIVSMPKKGVWKCAYFNVLNSKMQEFGLNETVCLRISLFSGPRSTLLRSIADTE